MDKYENLIARLRQYPELFDRVVSLVDIVEDKYDSIELADDAEECVIKNMQNLGHNALSSWAKNKSLQKCDQFLKQKKGRKDIKKK